MFGLMGILSESHSPSSSSSSSSSLSLLVTSALPISPADLTVDAGSTVLALISESFTVSADSTSDAGLTVSADWTLEAGSTVEADVTVLAGSTVEADTTLVAADSGNPISLGLSWESGRVRIYNPFGE
ncbi:hypothetical protein C8R42DRAFT_679720 [Lentinula raphanica]|nr:hypothetical protein C8R42DRAFT_679720 [Lentinula raphanica]